jgi:SAM-dependent methyltransferase
VVPEGFDPGAIYDDGYFRGGAYSDYQASEQVLRRQFRRIVRRLRHVVPDGGRLVEWGCAYGFFLLEAEAHFKCRGVELADGARQRARARGLDVFHPSDEGWKSESPFDVAVLLDCIEHLPDPGETLARLSGVVRRNGVLLLTTGDWGSLYARASGPRWRLMTPPEHLYFYTARSLRRLLNRHGFEVHEIRHPWKLVPLGLIMHQLRMRTGLPLPRLPDWLGVPVNLFDAMRVLARKI